MSISQDNSACPVGACEPLAWLSISEEENDGEGFLRSLLTAWEAVQPDIHESPLGLLLGSMSPEREAVLSAFINVANDIPDHMVFVLDDYHQIEDPSIHQALTFLLDHLPPTLHFVLAGRLKLTAGDIAAAGECLERARPLVEGAPFPDWIGRFGRLQLECWLAQDRLRAAVEWADEMLRDNAPEGQPESVVAHLAITRVLIVKGVRLPETPARVWSILRQNGYGASLDAGRIANEFVQWRGALTRDTNSMRNERDLVRAIVSWRGWRPGLTFEDAELARVQQPTLYVYGTADPLGTVDLAKRAVDLLPLAELYLVDDGGHLPWFHDLSQVGSHVSRFLAR